MFSFAQATASKIQAGNQQAFTFLFRGPLMQTEQCFLEEHRLRCFSVVELVVVLTGLLIGFGPVVDCCFAELAVVGWPGSAG